MLLIRQTIATYNDMPHGARCQQNLRIKKWRVATQSRGFQPKETENRDGKVNVKQVTRNNRDNVCNQ